MEKVGGGEQKETDKWQTNKANTLFKFVIKIPAYSIYYSYIWHNAQINMAYRLHKYIYNRTVQIYAGLIAIIVISRAHSELIKY